jgi:predicted alpha/beta superfamily hydrolase
MKKTIILGFVIFIINSISVFAQNDNSDIVIGKRKNIYSKVLDENRELLIYVPGSYAGNNYKKYPVIYLLDGGTLFNSFSAVVDRLSSDASPQIPEMIVVGINTSKNRLRDASPTKSLIGYRGIQEDGLEVTGGADVFLKFIKSELIPYIDSSYRTDSYRTFVGYSFTGLPVLHSLFTQKDLFNSYLVIDFSAWWDNQVTLRNFSSFLDTYHSKKPVDLFMSTEERVINKVYPAKVNATWTFMQAFKKKHPENINYGMKKYKYREENHHSMPLISFMDGLKYIFRGHMIHYDEMYNSPELIKLKFDMLSKRLGVKIALREDLVNYFGYQFLYTHKDIKKAMFYFKLNVENFPQSSNAFDSLAEGCLISGDKRKAIEYYEKAVLLDPANSNSVKMLNELKSQK